MEVSLMLYLLLASMTTRCSVKAASIQPCLLRMSHLLRAVPRPDANLLIDQRRQHGGQHPHQERVVAPQDRFVRYSTGTVIMRAMMLDKAQVASSVCMCS